MEPREKLELTPEEQSEADEYNRRMSAMMAVARALNGPNAPSIPDLFPNAIRIGEMESAATSGNLWEVKQALNAGADPNEPSATYGTAVHAAAAEGYLEIVQLLVGQGADPQRQNDEGETPADVAAASGHHEVAEYLRLVAPTTPPSGGASDSPHSLFRDLRRWLRLGG
jgi:ankyrin repeat protein